MLYFADNLCCLEVHIIRKSVLSTLQIKLMFDSVIVLISFYFLVNVLTASLFMIFKLRFSIVQIRL